jgi:hypothetical protein
MGLNALTVGYYYINTAGGVEAPGKTQPFAEEANRYFVFNAVAARESSTERKEHEKLRQTKVVSRRAL